MVVSRYKEKAKTLFKKVKKITKIIEGCDSEVSDSKLKKPSQTDLAHWMGMDYSRFSTLLPYRYFDEVDRLFINAGSIGFGCELAPLSGANEEIINGIAEMLKEKLDHTVSVQIMLVGSNKVGDLLSGGDDDEEEFIDDTFKSLAKSQYRYLKNAAVNGFHNKRGIPMPLRDYRCFIFVSKRVGYKKLEALKLSDLRKDLLTELKNVGIPGRSLCAKEFMGLVRDLINLKPSDINGSNEDLDKYKELHEQAVDPSYGLTVYPTYLESQVAGSEKVQLVSLSLKALPKVAMLWDQSNHFSNIFKPHLGIPCPFVISIHFKCDHEERAKMKANNKNKSYDKKASVAAYCKKFTKTAETAADWAKISKDLETREISLCKVYYTCMLFTNEKNRREHVSRALSSFRVSEVDLYSIKYQHLQSYLSLMPFKLEEGLWEDLKFQGRLNTMTTWNLTNMLPLVADYKGIKDKKGLVAPTFRNQISRIDNFNPSLDNYNVCVTATSGSGKSVLAQSMIASVLADGGKVWAIDLGQSYKKFCETMGGSYLDASNLKLNPFSSVTDISRSGESIRDLIAVMASPNEGLGDVQKAHLLDAVIDAFSNKGTGANMDDVIDYLVRVSEAGVRDPRINDVVVLLKKFSPSEAPEGSAASRIFNEASRLVTDDPKKERFVVLELGELESQPDLLKSVLFALILNIEEQMYHGDQSRKKLCVIDEAWRLLSGSNKIAASFIEKGFRTARKHYGAFAIISQRIKDFYVSIEAQAAWSCSETKIVMRQNEKDFKDFIHEQPDYFSEYEQTLIKGFRSSSENGFSEFMVQQGNISRFHRLFLDPFSRVMYSSRAEEHLAVKSLVDSGMSMSDAISEVAYQLFGEEIQAINDMEKSA